MKSTKKELQVAKREFAVLKARIGKQTKANKAFVKSNCPTLAKVLKKQWCLNEQDICDEVRWATAKDVFSALRMAERESSFV